MLVWMEIRHAKITFLLYLSYDLDNMINIGVIYMEIMIGICIPLLGTTLGAAMALFMRNSLHHKMENILLGFASGVMLAASFWSLILPSLEMAQEQGGVEWLPAAAGFLAGTFFLLCLDCRICQGRLDSEKAEELPVSVEKNNMLMTAVTIHNIPEGMAVGVAFAGALYGHVGVSFAAALSLAIGIAIQNIPEGTIISMPLRSAGISRRKAFLMGVLSGVVEPFFAALTILFSQFVVPILPYLLSFAAGAMMYVVTAELIPESQASEKNMPATAGVALGFVLMMVLDIALG